VEAEVAGKRVVDKGVVRKVTGAAAASMAAAATAREGGVAGGSIEGAAPSPSALQLETPFARRRAQTDPPAPPTPAASTSAGEAGPGEAPSKHPAPPRHVRARASTAAAARDGASPVPSDVASDEVSRPRRAGGDAAPSGR
jgi:hypothetical protein